MGIPEQETKVDKTLKSVCHPAPYQSVLLTTPTRYQIILINEINSGSNDCDNR